MSKEAFVYQEAHFNILRLLELNPKIKQRELAAAAGVSHHLRDKRRTPRLASRCIRGNQG